MRSRFERDVFEAKAHAMQSWNGFSRNMKDTQFNLGALKHSMPAERMYAFSVGLTKRLEAMNPALIVELQSGAAAPSLLYAHATGGRAIAIDHTLAGVQAGKAVAIKYDLNVSYANACAINGVNLNNLPDGTVLTIELPHNFPLDLNLEPLRKNRQGFALLCSEDHPNIRQLPPIFDIEGIPYSIEEATPGDTYVILTAGRGVRESVGA